MKYIKPISAIFSLLILTSCLLNTTNIEEIDMSKTQIVFYSNAQSVMDCGSFEIEVFLDSIFVGKIREAYSFDVEPDCFDLLSTLIVNADTGLHVYLAKADCGKNTVWYDTIRITLNNCHSVFLDAEALFKVPE